jgi:type IV secretory pathway VirB10-like protein
MNKMITMRGMQVLAGAALLMFASLGHAQYVWVDAKGIKQFSDRPPPPGTPMKNIIKARNMQAVQPTATTADETTPATPATPAAPKAVPPSLAEREAEYRKRKADQVENEKKAAVESDNAKTKMAACNSARQAKAQLDSGTPIRDTNEERSWLDDKQRAERKAAAEKTIGEHCN